jgi:hypothetical protein
LMEHFEIIVIITRELMMLVVDQHSNCLAHGFAAEYLIFAENLV